MPTTTKEKERAGMTILRVTHYEPWFLGWCHWRIVVSHVHSGTAWGVTVTVAEGKWLWRGRNTLFEEWSQFGTEGYEIYGTRSRKLAEVR